MEREYMGEDRISAGDLEAVRGSPHSAPHPGAPLLRRRGNRLGMLTNNTSKEGLIMLTRCCVSGLLACLAFTSRRCWRSERARGEEPKLLFSAKEWLSLDEHLGSLSKRHRATSPRSSHLIPSAAQFSRFDLLQ
ncbi:hypothetical protein BJY00DRAFT_123631 [Aspergillus carlsbadensis]|nr:hypothetical protein BJY00DRAFT_123631 [Aspergillus carlsbadensis]